MINKFYERINPRKKYMNREIKSISRNFDRLDLKLYSLNENISCFEK